MAKQLNSLKNQNQNAWSKIVVPENQLHIENQDETGIICRKKAEESHLRDQKLPIQMLK